MKPAGTGVAVALLCQAYLLGAVLCREFGGTRGRR